MKSFLRRLTLPIVLLGIAGAVVWGFLPQPVPVDTGTVTRTDLRVTVDEDGRTRIRERYVVSAPLAGRLLRVELDPGDPVERGHTVVALIEAPDPELLDARAVAEAEARVAAREAALGLADTTRDQTAAELDLAAREFARVEELLRRGAATQQEVDRARATLRLRVALSRAAEFSETIARFELEQARAALRHSRPAGDGTEAPAPFAIRAPIGGLVLRVLQQSESVVSPGTPLLELGDPADLEVVVDVLSADAVRIRPGARMLLEHWGGDLPLEATVRLVEPSAVTKVSALGVEEQRVDVVADLTSPPEQRKGLGDGFRVEARIVIWESDDVLTVPAGALFRRGGEWAVFVVRDGLARATDVAIGHRNALRAQVLSGLSDAEEVILYPGDRVDDGVPVEPR